MESVKNYKNLNYELVIKKVLEILEDRKQLERMHPSSNPYIPKQMRKSFTEMSSEIKNYFGFSIG